MYSYNEVLESTLIYFGGDLLASEVFINKYCMKDKEGNYLEKTPADMHHRLAKEFFRIEDNYNDLSGEKGLSSYGVAREALTEERIFELFDKFHFVVPQGSVMAVLGNPYIFGSLSNCVVLPELFDSYGGIMFADQQLVQLMKRRCGVGLDISPLRPENTAVSNAAGASSGAVYFAERFSNTTREVAQDGRRGALMITMDIKHPDAEKFALIKQDLKKVTGANISLRLSDEFMSAVEKDLDYAQQWPVDSTAPSIKKIIKARDLWNTIAKCAHNAAEPGLLFWDRHHWYSTSSLYPQYKNISSNPCGEICMSADSCRLIALDLFGFVDSPFAPETVFNFKKFYAITYEAQRMMDDLVDLELESITRMLKKIQEDPEPEHIKRIEKLTWEILYMSSEMGRRTGLGFTALADTLVALNLKFDSDEALKVVEQIMRTKCQAEFDSSIDMAIQRGTFSGFDPKIEEQSLFVQMLKKEFPGIYSRMMQYGRRNVSISTVSPTGSLSLLTQSSSGLEPVFTLSYKRRVKVNPSDKNAKVDFVDGLGDKWQEFEVFHSKFQEWMKVTGKIDKKDSPYFGATANEIDWMRRIEMQGIIQKYTTHSLSSTINLPADVSVEKVKEIYMAAWKMGLKGITVYRDTSRSGVLISQTDEKQLMINEHDAPKRPKVLDAEIVRFINDKEKWIAFVGLLNGKPYELFTGLQEQFVIPNYVDVGKIRRTKSQGNGGKYDFVYLDKSNVEQVVENLQVAFDKEHWNYAKLMSGILRHGMPTKYVVELVNGLNLKDDSLNTWKAGVVRALKKYIPNNTINNKVTCEQCESTEGMVWESGCVICKTCGWSKCN